ncbi:hypothetical protein NL676_026069 [Syzygium grande]|nr:hypothetical protein NL676_026069 [Syzygium grande]
MQVPPVTGTTPNAAAASTAAAAIGGSRRGGGRAMPAEFRPAQPYRMAMIMALQRKRKGGREGGGGELLSLLMMDGPGNVVWNGREGNVGRARGGAPGSAGPTNVRAVVHVSSAVSPARRCPFGSTGRARRRRFQDAPAIARLRGTAWTREYVHNVKVKRPASGPHVAERGSRELLGRFRPTDLSASARNWGVGGGMIGKVRSKREIGDRVDASCNYSGGKEGLGLVAPVESIISRANGSDGHGTRAMLEHCYSSEVYALMAEARR